MATFLLGIRPQNVFPTLFEFDHFIVYHESVHRHQILGDMHIHNDSRLCCNVYWVDVNIVGKRSCDT
jgi:hypothetical protein